MGDYYGLGDRIKMLRKKKALSRAELASICKISAETIARWERDQREPGGDMLRVLAEALNTTVAYLMGEIDDPRIDAFEHAGDAFEGSGLIDEETLKKLFANRQTQKDFMGETGSPPPSRNESNIVGDIIYPKGGFIKIPLIDVNTCAGVGWTHEFIDMEVVSYELIPSGWVGRIDELRPPFMVTIRGDSMEDANLPDGFFAVVNPAEEVYSGDSAMVCYGENKTVAIKRVYHHPGGKIELRSASPGYPNIIYSRDQQISEIDGLEIIGKVVAVSGKPKRG